MLCITQTDSKFPYVRIGLLAETKQGMLSVVITRQKIWGENMPCDN